MKSFYKSVQEWPDGQRQTAKPMILLVDDQPANLTMLAAALGDDYVLKVATSGPLALELAQTQPPPDLILLDIIMPGMDGYEVCRQLKKLEQTRKIPVIYLTAKNDLEDEACALAVGAVDYITKPFSLPILQARVKTHILLKRNSDLLESIAFLDGLTSIANRRKFDLTIAAEWKRARRNLTPLALIMIDIDFFKQYNDYYGHGAGDSCLQQIAGVLHTAVYREGDLVARYGGEEFVAVMPETDLAGVQAVAERLRVEISELEIPHRDSMVNDYVTISLGVCSLIPDEGKSESMLLEKADQALYRAKEAGRNRVEVCCQAF